MTKADALKYFLYETDFLESLLSHLPKLYFLDAIKQRTEMVMYDVELFKEDLYNVEIQIIKVLKLYIREVDYTNEKKNKQLLNAFFKFFEEID
jgi:hypothetical protein